MPRLTQFYGIQPPDIDRYTVREISEYLTQMHRAESEGGI